MIATLVFAFSVGAISSVNPCGFAFLPVYFAQRLGTATSDGSDKVAMINRALCAGTIATTGFIVVFGVIGVVVSLGAVWLTGFLPWAGFAIGFVLVAVGVLVLSGRRIEMQTPFGYPIGTNSSLKNDFLFGLGYGTASLSCTLPIFLSITGIAVTGEFGRSLLSFIAFALGMGTVLTAVAVGAALSQDGLTKRIKRFLPIAYRFGGGVLSFAGLYVIYYWGSVLLTSEVPSISGVVGVAERISGSLRNVIGGEVGEAVLLGLFFVFATALGWSGIRRLFGTSSNVGAAHSDFSKE